MQIKYRILWELGGVGHEVGQVFDSYQAAENYALESDELPYDVKRCRNGSYWIEPESE